MTKFFIFIFLLLLALAGCQPPKEGTVKDGGKLFGDAAVVLTLGQVVTFLPNSEA